MTKKSARTLTLAKIRNTDFYFVVCHDFNSADMRGAKSPEEAAMHYVGTGSFPTVTLNGVVATFTDWGMEPTQLLEPIASKEVDKGFDFDTLSRWNNGDKWRAFFGQTAEEPT